MNKLYFVLDLILGYVFFWFLGVVLASFVTFKPMHQFFWPHEWEPLFYLALLSVSTGYATYKNIGRTE